MSVPAPNPPEIPIVPDRGPDIAPNRTPDPEIPPPDPTIPVPQRDPEIVPDQTPTEVPPPERPPQPPVRMWR